MNIAYLTGLRISDVLALRKTEIGTDYLATNESKTGTRARYAMTPSLAVAISKHRSLPCRASGITIIRNHSGGPYTLDGFESIFYRYVRKAIDKGFIDKPFTFHDIRAKHGTDKDEAGLNAQLALGHTDFQTSKKYIRHPLGRVVEPLDFLPGGEQGETQGKRGNKKSVSH